MSVATPEAFFGHATHSDPSGGRWSTALSNRRRNTTILEAKTMAMSTRPLPLRR